MSLPTLALLAAAAALPLGAQKPFEFWPGAAYDPKIPTLRTVAGHDPGERITGHAGIVRYFEALAAASPRVKVFPYGESWQGRKLVYAAVGSESNLKRLDEIRASMQRLADPRKTPAAEARKIAASIPAVIWLAYGVHGNEISSPDAAMLTAYHLAAGRNDRMAERILANVLVLVCPTQNPDGRDRFIHHFESTRGLEPDASPVAAEHNEQWPGGRSNHYLFDLNRDWLVLSQPEIRSQVKALREWLPLVYVDLHEMGSESTYYFAPEADPYNPHIERAQRENLALFGRNNAKWFDKLGFDYFTREVFDAFYPGYGASWPAYYGAIAMTYEQASVRGLAVRRADGGTMHFRDTVRQHFTASLSTAEAAADNRAKLLDDFYRYRSSAIEEGSKEKIREYILPRGRDAAATDKLAALLTEHGIEVKRASAAFEAGGRKYAAGTYVVPMAQPAKRLARTLLDPETPMDEPFLKAEAQRRERRQRSEIYDVTAWSLPQMFNVEAVQAAEPSQGSFEPVRAERIRPGEMRGGKASLAYLAPWGSQAAGRLLAAALRQDLRIHTSDKALALGGAKFPSGTLIFKVKENPADLADRLARLARETGADVYATDTGWVEDGVNFGSRHVFHMRKPNILMAWDTPASTLSAGWTRFVLERQFGYPVTVVRTSQIAAADLARFHVVILPSGTNYAQALTDRGVERLKAWVDAGGTIVALGEAVAFLAEKKTGLLDVSLEDAWRGTDAKKTDAPPAAGAPVAAVASAPVAAAAPPVAAAAPPVAAAAPPAAAAPGAPRTPGKLLASDAEYARAILPDREPPEASQGVLARARVLPDHWLTAGLGEYVHAMAVGRSIYSPLKADKGVNAAWFDAPDKLLAGGFLWPEVRRQMAYKPLVMMQTAGRGVAIGFTGDPNFRGALDGMNVFFLNAVFRGPAHARPPTAE